MARDSRRCCAGRYAAMRAQCRERYAARCDACSRYARCAYGAMQKDILLFTRHAARAAMLRAAMPRSVTRCVVVAALTPIRYARYAADAMLMPPCHCCH